jgi:hypothetical protein
MSSRVQTPLTGATRASLPNRLDYSSSLINYYYVGRECAMIGDNGTVLLFVFFASFAIALDKIIAPFGLVGWLKKNNKKKLETNLDSRQVGRGPWVAQDQNKKNKSS